MQSTGLQQRLLLASDDEEEIPPKPTTKKTKKNQKGWGLPLDTKKKLIEVIESRGGIPVVRAAIY